MNSELNIKKIMIKKAKKALSSTTTTEVFATATNGGNVNININNVNINVNMNAKSQHKSNPNMNMPSFEEEEEYTSDEEEDEDDDDDDNVSTTTTSSASSTSSQSHGHHSQGTQSSTTNPSVDELVKTNTTQESRLLFQIYLARLFSHNITVAYKDMIALEMQNQLLEELESEKKETVPKNQHKKGKNASKKQKEPPKMGKAPPKKQAPPQQITQEETAKKKKKNKKRVENDEMDEETVLVHQTEFDDNDWNVVQKHKKHVARPTSTTTPSIGNSWQPPSQHHSHHERRSSSTSPPLSQPTHVKQPIVSPTPVNLKTRENNTHVGHAQPTRAPVWSTVVAKDLQERPINAKTSSISITAHDYRREQRVSNDKWGSFGYSASPNRFDSDIEDRMDHMFKNIVDDNDDEDLAHVFESNEDRFMFANNNNSMNVFGQYRKPNEFVPVIGYELFGTAQSGPAMMNIIGEQYGSQEEEGNSPQLSPHLSNPFHLPSVTSQVFGFGSIL
jgi:hypothetical protein